MDAGESDTRDKPALKIDAYLSDNLSRRAFTFIERDGRYQVSWRDYFAGKWTGEFWDGDSMWSDNDCAYKLVATFLERYRGSITGYSVRELGIEFDRKTFNRFASIFRLLLDPDYN